MTGTGAAVPVVVQKYGGTSVATADHISKIADRVASLRKKTPRLAVVLSAMGKATDELIALAHQVSSDPRGREMDLLLATGEQVSVSLLGLALQNRGSQRSRLPRRSAASVPTTLTTSPGSSLSIRHGSTPNSSRDVS